MSELERVHFTGGPLDGAVLDLPPQLVGCRPGRLTITAGGKVYDRERGQRVLSARIVTPPRARQ